MKATSFKIFLLKKAFNKQGVIVLVIAIFIAVFCLPKFSSWAYFKISTSNYYSGLQYTIRSNSQPEFNTIEAEITAYSSSYDETNGNPCISASGYNLCKHDRENVVACNFLPFGTKIRIPELDPDKIYTVVDRMHERFENRIDIWKKTKQEAKNFGLKNLTVEIYRE